MNILDYSEKQMWENIILPTLENVPGTSILIDEIMTVEHAKLCYQKMREVIWNPPAEFRRFKRHAENFFTANWYDSPNSSFDDGFMNFHISSTLERPKPGAETKNFIFDQYSIRGSSLSHEWNLWISVLFKDTSLTMSQYEDQVYARWHTRGTLFGFIKTYYMTAQDFENRYRTNPFTSSYYRSK